MPAEGTPIRLYTFDAASLPFAEGTMSAVFAHSVLHHLLRYEDALRETHRVLRPGGVAVFAEPMLDFYALHSFLADVILMLDARNPTAVLSDKEKSLLSAISKTAASTAQSMRHDREKLAHQEDKHMFLLEDMRALSRELGFTDFTFTPAYTPPKLGDAFKKEIAWVLGRHQGDATRLDEYQCVFDAVTERLGPCYGKRWPASFGYLTFVK
jgi:ubiquinone/menaquinone biosynthesis C-methylase UbiE